jgi:protease I
MNPKAVSFVKAFFDAKKPVAAICHGPWTLVEAGVVKGRKLTSYESIKTDILNAGGKWQDREVVVDMGLVTSRKPDDIPAFNRKMIEEFQEGPHDKPRQEEELIGQR